MPAHHWPPGISIEEWMETEKNTQLESTRLAVAEIRVATALVLCGLAWALFW